MQPIKLEIFLDDKTRSGMQSAERNITGLETQMQEVINILKKELIGLQSAFKDALSTGVSSPSDLADIQALKGKIVELEEELKECLFCLRRNEMKYDMETDTDLIEQRIYERQALLCRYRYLLARARELGLHTILKKYQPLG